MNILVFQKNVNSWSLKYLVKLEIMLRNTKMNMLMFPNEVYSLDKVLRSTSGTAHENY